MLSLLATLLTGAAVPYFIKIIDPKSIVSVRRFLGLLFASNLVWILPVIVGSIFSSFTALHANSTEFVLGAFLAWSFQLVIIKGAFIRSTALSLVLAGLQPLAVLLVLTSGRPIIDAFVPSVFTLVICLLFLSRVDSVKTKSGLHSLDLLRAFLKTWVGHEPSDLEAYFSSYASKQSVQTAAVIAQTQDGTTALVLPGVHPGPFSPVGSYNVSELIYDNLKKEGITTVVLHGTGGHEKNIPTNELTSIYAKQVSEFVDSSARDGTNLIRGPLRSKVGQTNITTIGFGKDLLAFITNAPYRSDDLDPEAVTSAFQAASELGLNIITIDAHNSVNGEDLPQANIAGDTWRKVLNDSIETLGSEFSLGSANSSEVGFKPSGDISDGGVSVVVFATAERKTVLISADSNNAISGLRERLAGEMASTGVELIDLCTSDTHKLAARNLTERGYFALGEYTDTETIIELVKKLLAIALSRLRPCRVQVSKLQSEVMLIGSESLDDFAAVTKRATSLSKQFVELATPVLVLLLAVTLFY